MIRERVIRLVEESGRTQKANAELCGIAKQTFYNVVEGYTRCWTTETLVKVARHFDVSTDWLLGISDTRRRFGE